MKKPSTPRAMVGQAGEGQSGESQEAYNGVYSPDAKSTEAIRAATAVMAEELGAPFLDTPGVLLEVNPDDLGVLSVRAGAGEEAAVSQALERVQAARRVAESLGVKTRFFVAARGVNLHGWLVYPTDGEQSVVWLNLEYSYSSVELRATLHRIF